MEEELTKGTEKLLAGQSAGGGGLVNRVTAPQQRGVSRGTGAGRSGRRRTVQSLLDFGNGVTGDLSRSCLGGGYREQRQPHGVGSRGGAQVTIKIGAEGEEGRRRLALSAWWLVFRMGGAGEV